MAMQKRKVEKASKKSLCYKEDDFTQHKCPQVCTTRSLLYEEEILTNFQNKDKIKRKENKW